MAENCLGWIKYNREYEKHRTRWRVIIRPPYHGIRGDTTRSDFGKRHDREIVATDTRSASVGGEYERTYWRNGQRMPRGGGGNSSDRMRVSYAEH